MPSIAQKHASKLEEWEPQVSRARRVEQEVLDLLDEPITPDELDRALEVAPLTGAEIVRSSLTEGWSHKKIDDGEEWVQEQRRQRREERARR